MNAKTLFLVRGSQLFTNFWFLRSIFDPNLLKRERWLFWMKVSGQFCALVTLRNRENHVTHWIKGWVDPRDRLDILEQRTSPCPCQNLNPKKIILHKNTVVVKLINMWDCLSVCMIVTYSGSKTYQYVGLSVCMIVTYLYGTLENVKFCAIQNIFIFFFSLWCALCVT